MDTTLTFDQVERRAERTLGIVLWARHARNIASLVLWFSVLSAMLRSLVKSLARDKQLSSISDAQAEELNKTLREIYSSLQYILKRDCVAQWKQIPVLGSAIIRVEEDAVDLGDIIEDLAFSCNHEFRSMIAECAKTVRTTSAHSAELIGRM